ncbi:MAG: hypothetical protein M1348_01780 [Candidatus Parvarchaeota archaeon]|nr:hypothetical protein [Candidatus Parvarchaeota archaeon]
MSVALFATIVLWSQLSRAAVFAGDKFLQFCSTLCGGLLMHDWKLELHCPFTQLSYAHQLVIHVVFAVAWA